MSRDHAPLRYFPWLTRDALLWPFRVFVLAAVALSLLVWRFANTMHLPRGRLSAGGAVDPMAGNVAQSVQTGVWVVCLTVAILITVGGIVGTDLERGYYRSWFSKPMSPVWYYLQRMIIGAVVILLCPVVLGAGLALAVHGSTGLTWALMGQIGLGYLLVASATLLLSIFTSRGWLLVFLLSVVHGMLTRFLTIGVLPNWLVQVYHLLPPFQLVQPGAPIPRGGELWHLVGYGTGMLVLALTLLRTRPLGSTITS